LLFRWFVGLAIEDSVWNHSVFSKNRDRLIEHDAVTELFNATVAMAERRGLLSGEHFRVDGTLIQAWAGHKSVRRKDGADDDRPPQDWRGERRSNETHESKTDPDSRLCRKSDAAPAILGYQGHVLSDNRHGLVVDAVTSTASGTAEREAAVVMLAAASAKTKRCHGRCRQGLRYPRLRRLLPAAERHAARGAEQHAARRQCDRCAHDTARWLPDQSTQTQTD
jgi:hypothetical protein